MDSQVNKPELENLDNKQEENLTSVENKSENNAKDAAATTPEKEETTVENAATAEEKTVDAPEKEEKDAKDETVPAQTEAEENTMKDKTAEDTTEEDKENVQETETADSNESNEDADTTNAGNMEQTEETAKEEPLVSYKTKTEIIDRIKQIATNEELPDKDEINHLKTSFYKLHIAERNAKQKAYLDAGGDPEKYQIKPDEDEEIFKAEMGLVKERRAEYLKKLDQKREENLERKLAIIEKIKSMSTSPDQANKSFNEFKNLQQEWRDIKPVPANKAKELWRNYQFNVEQYYDQLNLNREARDYDFKKNLNAKTKLCEEAERLTEEADVISAFHQLQELHQQWREIGPVAKELREDLWNRFKTASTAINKRHQQHFEELKAKESDNLKRKTELCEKVEAIANTKYENIGDWNKYTKEIVAIQKEWRTIGFAPQKTNVTIFQRFRAACDLFFNNKSEFFKELKKDYAENAEKKKALIEKALALKDSKNWRSTTDKLINIQKEWKEIGPVPRKQSNELWQQFQEACNAFFNARNEANKGKKNEEEENLEQKQQIIGQLKELVDAQEEDVKDKVYELIDRYNAIGHVPYKEKDKIWKAFHDVSDEVFEKLHISLNRRRLDNFKKNLKKVAMDGDDAIDNERGRLMHQFEQLKSQINIYENNLGAFTVSSKKGNSLVEELNRKIEKLKEESELIKQKIKTIDSRDHEDNN